MRKQRAVGRSRGHTLVELMVALAVAGVLWTGLVSSMFIALQASDTSDSPEALTLEAQRFLADIAAEMRFATLLNEQGTTAVTFVVADRADADATDEVIRYAWSGTSGDPVTRQYNGGAVANVVDSALSFSLDYYQPGEAVEYVTVSVCMAGDERTWVETTVPMLNRP